VADGDAARAGEVGLRRPFPAFRLSSVVPGIVALALGNGPPVVPYMVSCTYIVSCWFRNLQLTTYVSARFAEKIS